VLHEAGGRYEQSGRWRERLVHVRKECGKARHHGGGDDGDGRCARHEEDEWIRERLPDTGGEFCFPFQLFRRLNQRGSEPTALLTGAEDPDRDNGSGYPARIKRVSEGPAFSQVSAGFCERMSKTARSRNRLCRYECPVYRHPGTDQRCQTPKHDGHIPPAWSLPKKLSGPHRGRGHGLKSL
jgi:hypothetical protein